MKGQTFHNCGYLKALHSAYSNKAFVLTRGYGVAREIRLRKALQVWQPSGCKLDIVPIHTWMCFDFRLNHREGYNESWLQESSSQKLPVEYVMSFWPLVKSGCLNCYAGLKPSTNQLALGALKGGLDFKQHSINPTVLSFLANSKSQANRHTQEKKINFSVPAVN